MGELQPAHDALDWVISAQQNAVIKYDNPLPSLLFIPMDLKIDSWPVLLGHIRKRPELWLNKRSPISLGTFYWGIKFSEKIYKVPEIEWLSGFDFEAFERWVEYKYNPRKLTFNSMHLAVHLCESEETAFNKWFEWYDLFMLEHG
ncbi:MAG TPA: hypothetical protein VI457_03415 [Methylococcaceae bacterium]|nr:hypothetical protein [Methylococcaceae bacterium]